LVVGDREEDKVVAPAFRKVNGRRLGGQHLGVLQYRDGELVLEAMKRQSLSLEAEDFLAARATRRHYTDRVTEFAIPHKPLTVEKYLKLEEESALRHEYVGGTIYAHAGGTSRHNVVAVNILASLWNASRGGPCHVYNSDMMLRAAEDVFYYPDVMVVCGPDEAGAEALYQDAPCLVVEVASPSTQAIDRREKLLAYRKLPSLRAYLIVDQQEMRVERHWRDEAKQWWQAEISGPEGVVPFPCPETELTLQQIYEGL
jgi:Uma2 family endonuclease